MVEPDLGGLQRWMLGVVTAPAPDASDGAAAIAERILPSATLTAEERIGIYAGMYYERLIGVLFEDFPALAAFLGAATLRATCIDYLVAHPSRHYSLNELGARLPRFLAEEADELPGRAFAAELGALERGVQEVFDGPPSETLSAEDLANVPPQGWAELALTTVPALRLFRFEHRVNEWYAAWREGESARAPVAGTTFLALVRRDYKVWRFDLEPEEHALLAELSGGAPLGQALGSAAARPEVDAARLAAGVQEWFRRWSGLGFFRALPS